MCAHRRRQNNKEGCPISFGLQLLGTRTNGESNRRPIKDCSSKRGKLAEQTDVPVSSDLTAKVSWFCSSLLSCSFSFCFLAFCLRYQKRKGKKQSSKQDKKQSRWPNKEMPQLNSDVVNEKGFEFIILFFCTTVTHI